jgi:hypothetical protein
MEFILFRPTHHGMNDGWMKEIRPHDPTLLVGYHDCASNQHTAIPKARSDAVVTARSEGML